MAELVYLLGALASISCAVLLLRSYFRAHLPIILWTSLCFALLAAQNILLFVDLVLFPDVRLAVLRNLVGLSAIVALLYSLIWENP